MEAQQYLDIQQTVVTTSSNHVEIILMYEISQGCAGWNHDLSYSEICDFPLSKDILATIYENNI